MTFQIFKSPTTGEIIKGTDDKIVTSEVNPFVYPAHCPDPGLCRWYNVTFSGLGGDFAPWNGLHCCTAEALYGGNCQWKDDQTAPYHITQLYWHVGSVYITWRVSIQVPGIALCWLNLDGGSDPCDPTADVLTYVGGGIGTLCQDVRCVDNTSCDLSAGATAVVEHVA